MAKDKPGNSEEEKMESIQNTMAARVRDEGFWRELWHQVRLVWYLLRDPEVPLMLKALPVLAVLYVLVPTDLLPDVFPVMGQLDDVMALMVGGKVFIEMSPPHVVARYLRAMHGQSEVADGEATPDAELQDAIIIEGEFEELEE